MTGLWDLAVIRSLSQFLISIPVSKSESLYSQNVFSIRQETKSIATSGFYNICAVPTAELFLLFSSKVPKKNFD